MTPSRSKPPSVADIGRRFALSRIRHRGWRDQTWIGAVLTEDIIIIKCGCGGNMLKYETVQDGELSPTAESGVDQQLARQ